MVRRRRAAVAMALVSLSLAPVPLVAGAVPSTPAAAVPGSGATSVLAAGGGVVWAYDGSQVLRSTDDGGTWRALLPTWSLSPTSLQVTGAFFLNGNDAWAETEHEWPAQPGVTTTWQTTDGGATWHQGVSLPGPTSSFGTPGFDEFAFSDVDHGFGFGTVGQGSAGPVQEGTGYLWASADGGRHWARVTATGLPWSGTTVAPPVPGGCGDADPFNLTALSAHVAFLADAGCPRRRPGLWRSGDGGRKWAPVALPSPPGGWPRAEAWHYPGRGGDGAEVLSVRFFPGGRGVAEVTTRPGDLVVYRSSDQGASWSVASVLETGSLARPAGFWASSPGSWELPAPAGLFLTTDAGRAWRLQRAGISLPALTEVSFAAPSTGIGFASSPAVGLSNTGYAGLRTADGGRSWSPVHFSPPAAAGQATTDIAFSTVDFVNTESGWVGGADGVEATTDGGRTWADQLSTTAPVGQLSFPDPQNGWALTPDQLLSTSDGGRSWVVRPESPLGAFSYVQRVTAAFGVGVICGQPGGTRVLVAANGGKSWALLDVPSPDQLDCGSVEPSSGATPGICFGSAQVAWEVVRGEGEAPSLVYKSEDGGHRWSEVATVNTWPGSLACQATTDAWLGLNWMENMSSAGSLAGTTDGGKTWRISVHPAPRSVFRLPVVKPADGTPVGTLGTAQSPKGLLAQPVTGLAAPAPGAVVDLWTDYGPACANGFGLAESTDGGTTWTGTPEPNADGQSRAGASMTRASTAGASTAGASPSASELTCGMSALPGLAAVPDLLPSVSYPATDDGFVLGPASGTPSVPKGATNRVTVNLVATTDAGKSWHLVAHFPWRPPA